MGCCKSKVQEKDTGEPLLTKRRGQTPNPDSNDHRGLSLHESFSPFSGLLGLALNHEKNAPDSDDEGGLPYMPPVIQTKKRIFEGKSLSKPPHLTDLHRVDWINKRGHLVKNWKNRYIELAHEAISYFDKCDSHGKGVNMKGQVPPPSPAPSL
jgi:hypothetical protein